jgi:hypothetical protein
MDDRKEAAARELYEFKPYPQADVDKIQFREGPFTFEIEREDSGSK